MNLQNLLSERITTVYVWADFYFSSRLGIVKIEALDQSQSFGGSVTSMDGGVNSSYVSLFFQPVFIGAQIDFIVNVYAESLGPNNITVGNLTENSVLMHT